MPLREKGLSPTLIFNVEDGNTSSATHEMVVEDDQRQRPIGNEDIEDSVGV
jgi:hypothetical protein